MSPLFLALLLVLALIHTAAASATTTPQHQPRFALFGRDAAASGTGSSSSQKERVLQGGGRSSSSKQQDRGTLGPLTAEDRKWDTGRFLRAVVDAQVSLCVCLVWIGVKGWGGSSID